MALLETRGLGKDYGSVRAVDALDLTVERGEIAGLLGPNGAGKTTAISMIAGVARPTRGRVTIAGHDLADSPRAARRALGLVPQELAVYLPLTARENLAFFGALYGLGGRELKGRIDWALDVVGLVDRAAHYSGGMLRRLNLAAGLLHRPPLVILDEPTVGVDPQSRNHIFATLRRLAADEGTAVLYTSHYMEEVELLCRRVAILDGGVVVAADSVEQLLARHGQPAVEVSYRGPVDAIVAALERLGPVSPVGESSDDAGRVRIGVAVRPGQIVRAVEAVGGEVESLAAKGGNLEQVFLTLTGHRLRDDP